MNRKTELYKIIVEDKHVNKEGFFDELKSDIILKTFFKDYYENIVYSNTIEEITDNGESVDSEVVAEEATSNQYDKKIDIKSKSICYYVKSVEEVDNENEEIDKTRNVIIEYIKYDKQLKVVDKDTLEKKFEKSKNQGDLEKQHYIIQTLDKSNKALIVWEKVLGAVTLGLIEKNINSAFRKWIRNNYENDKDKKHELLGFHIKIYPIPSKDIFVELSNLDKVSLMKVTVKKEKLTFDEDIVFSEDNISREDVDLIYKPIKGLSFSKSKVEGYVRKFINGEKIKRILISGKRDGNLITLNTELMKMSEYIDVKVGEDGLVDSEDLFKKYYDLINKDNEYFNEIFIDINLEE